MMRRNRPDGKCAGAADRLSECHGFRRLPSACPIDERLDHLTAFYRFLERECRAALACGALTGTIELLRRSYGITCDAVADTKAMDFLVGARVGSDSGSHRRIARSDGRGR